jgi:hypothetical protein
MLVSIMPHAFGKRYDLPVPLWLFVTGGAVVVFLSFLLVLPRTLPIEGVNELPDRLGRYTVRVPLAVLSWVILLSLIVAGLTGSQAIAENILPTAFWLIAWIAIPVSCGVLGNWTRPLNPYAALARAVDRPGLQRAILGGPPLAWPVWLGWWPAVVLFFIVACGELIYNASATIPAVTAFGLAVYALVNAAAALVFGSQAWLEHGELFSVLYGTWGRLGFLRFGAPGTTGFGGGLKARFDASVSRITFVLMLLASVSFDGLLATPAWKHAQANLPAAFAPGTAPYLIGTTLVFILLVLVGWALFGGFAAGVRSAGSLDGSVVQVLAGLLPSLLPIAFGYLVAHNLEYLVINGQLLFPLLGNPAGYTWWPVLSYPFNDTYELKTNLIPSGVFWYFDVALIIFVHIVAVILAHDYLIKAARTIRTARRAEWPWVVDMVLYTMSSLWLLAQPIVKGG